MVTELETADVDINNPQSPLDPYDYWRTVSSQSMQSAEKIILQEAQRVKTQSFQTLDILKRAIQIQCDELVYHRALETLLRRGTVTETDVVSFLNNVTALRQRVLEDIKTAGEQVKTP